MPVYLAFSATLSHVLSARCEVLILLSCMYASFPSLAALVDARLCSCYSMATWNEGEQVKGKQSTGLSVRPQACLLLSSSLHLIPSLSFHAFLGSDRGKQLAVVVVVAAAVVVDDVAAAVEAELVVEPLHACFLLLAMNKAIGQMECEVYAYALTRMNAYSDWLEFLASHFLSSLCVDVEIHVQTEVEMGFCLIVPVRVFLSSVFDWLVLI